MLNEKDLADIRLSLKKVFALPITKLTFLQIQNTIGQHTQDREEITIFMKALLTGSSEEFPEDKKKSEALKVLLDEFYIPTRIAKEVEERGELLHFITSESIEKSGTAYIYNRMRRVDGEEFLFVIDAETTVLLLEHFAQRLKGFKENEFQEKYRKRLKNLSQGIEKSIE